ncbi:MAG: hypothetical protein Q9159_005038 [Coniocarpon cinnabarinum]
MSGLESMFMETSAREKVNIEETFVLLIKRVAEARRQQTQGSKPHATSRTQPLTPLEEKADPNDGPPGAVHADDEKNKLKGMAEKMTNKEGKKQEGGQSSGQQDYLDKGFAAGEKKFGISENRERDEMITDKGREFIEKQTGKDIPDKVSN